MGEYLASGRPVLAHAPADSYVTWNLREHGCGIVVDEPDASKLADAIRRLMDDGELRRRLTENARVRAVDFSVETARAGFLKLLQAKA